MANFSLDNIDRQILETIRSEGRISNLELAERIALSPTPCSRRLKRLEECGAITGYSAKIHPAALGLNISALITVRLLKQSPEDVQGFLSAVSGFDEVTECLLVAGNFDYVLRVSVIDVEALREFILNKLKSISCVGDTTTMLILDTH